MEKMKVDELKIHPANQEIYHGMKDPDSGLTKSLREFGLQNPITVDEEGRILSGARRWTAAKELGWEEIEAEVESVSSDADARQYVLVANAYRGEKPTIVRYREVASYYSLLLTGDASKDEVEKVAEEGGVEPETQEPKTLAAAAAGFKKSTYHSMQRVLEEDGFEAEILHAVEEEQINRQQADDLLDALDEARDELEKGDIPPKSAKRRIKEALDQAQKEHQSKHALQRERALQATETALMQGKRLNSSLATLLELPDTMLDSADWTALRQVFEETNTLLAEVSDSCGVELESETNSDGRPLQDSESTQAEEGQRPQEQTDGEG